MSHNLKKTVPTTGRIALAALSAITGYGAFYHYTQYRNVSAKWQSIKATVADQTTVDLNGLDARFYPWVRDNNVKDWEFKRVTLRGYFKDERFFVRRQRDGKDGFLVFAAFVTAVDRVNHRLKQKDLLPIEHSVFVNLGWVPFDRKGDVELGGEVVAPLVNMHIRATRLLCFCNNVLFFVFLIRMHLLTLLTGSKISTLVRMKKYINIYI